MLVSGAFSFWLRRQTLTQVDSPGSFVCEKGFGSALSESVGRLRKCVQAVASVSDVPVTMKCRMGQKENQPIVHKYVGQLREWGASAMSLHARSRQQRYKNRAYRDYMLQGSELSSVPFIANGCVARARAQ